MSTILQTGKNVGQGVVKTIADAWIDRFKNEKQVYEARGPVTNLQKNLDARKEDRLRDQFRSFLGVPTVTDDHEAGRLK